MSQQATRPDTTIPTRRALLAGAPAVAAAALAGGTVANALAIAEAKAADADPIFAVIAEHQAAQKAVTAAFDREDREEDEDEVIWAAQARQLDAQFELFTTAPTTITGVAAPLAYLGTDAGDDPHETILEFAKDFGDEELVAAVRAFPLHLAAALAKIEGAQS
jgi:hypothetical protein